MHMEDNWNAEDEKRAEKIRNEYVDKRIAGIFKDLRESDKFEMYRASKAWFMEEEIRVRAEDKHVKLSEAQIAYAAHQYAYAGEYDDELNHFENLDHLIEVAENYEDDVQDQ